MVDMSTPLELATEAAVEPANFGTEPPHQQPRLAAEARNSAVRQWVAQLGPAAVLAGLAYLFHALIGVVYRSFDAALGVSAAEVGHDPATTASTLVAFDGFTLVFVVALFLPLLVGILATRRPNPTVNSEGIAMLACMAPAVLAACAHVPGDALLRQLIAFSALAAAIGFTVGLALTTLSPKPTFLPPVTMLVSVVAVKGLRVVLHGWVLFAAIVLLLFLLAIGLLLVLRRSAQQGRPLTDAFPLRWPVSLAQQSAVTFAVITLAALGGIWYIFHLDAAARSAAEQVRIYGYVTEAPDALDLTVRPITVRLLSTNDPLRVCSTTAPVALTQLNRTPGDPLVLVRRLTPGTLQPVVDDDPVIMRLPAAQYVSVQHLALWKPSKPRTGEPVPWTTAACTPDQ